jgi:hypothetical protein
LPAAAGGATAGTDLAAGLTVGLQRAGEKEE